MDLPAANGFAKEFFPVGGPDDSYFIPMVNYKLFKYGLGVSPKTGLSNEG
jgi:hypothetical protein